jgi:hypothetical protein
MCALYAISDSSFYDFAPALLSKPFYMIFSLCDDHKMKSSGMISPLKIELVPSVIKTCLPSLSGVDVRCLGLYVDGTVGSESNCVCVCVCVCVCMNTSGIYVSPDDGGKDCLWNTGCHLQVLIMQEDWLQKLFFTVTQVENNLEHNMVAVIRMNGFKLYKNVTHLLLVSILCDLRFSKHCWQIWQFSGTSWLVIIYWHFKRILWPPFWG